MITQGSVLWYYLFPLFITIIAVIGYKRQSSGRFILLLMLFFSMFRGDNVGNDTMKYMDMGAVATRADRITYAGNSYTTFDFSEDIGRDLEFGASLLNYIVYRTNSSPRVIIYVYSLITFLFLYFSLKRLGLSTAIGLMFYVLLSLYFFSLSAARQMAAISIFCYGITYLIKEGSNKLFFFLFLFLSAMFHISSIFYAWVFFVPYIKINRNILLVVIAAFCLFSCFTTFDIASLIYQSFNMTYIQNYEGAYDVNNRSFMGRLFDFLLFAFFIFVFYYRRMNEKEKNVKTDTYDVFFAFAVILMALFSHVSMLVARITYYLVIFIGFYMSKITEETNCMKKQEFLLPFFAYIILVESEFGGWAYSLQSGYYLTF